MDPTQDGRPAYEPCANCGTRKYPWNDCPSCAPPAKSRAWSAPSQTPPEESSEGSSSLLFGCAGLALPILGLVIFCAVLFNAGVSGPSEDSARAAEERARRAQIQANADRGYREWRAQCQQLERHLTPGERAVIVDERDRQDSIERAGRAGRRLGEALRDR